MNTNKVLTAEIAARYWGCKVTNGKEVREVFGVTQSHFIFFKKEDSDEFDEDILIEDYKLILTPLEQISDEDAIFVYEVIIGVPIGGDKYNVERNKTEVNIESIYNVDRDEKTNVFIPHTVEIYYSEDGTIHNVDGARMVEIVDFLRSKSYDCDGLIEQGIAISSEEAK